MNKLKFILAVIMTTIIFTAKVKADSGYTDQEIGLRIKDIVYENQGINNDYNVNYYDFLGTGFNQENNALTWSLVSYKTSEGYCIAYAGVLTDCNSTSFSMSGSCRYTLFKGSEWSTGHAYNPTVNGVINVVDNGLMSRWMDMVDYDNYVYDPSIYVPNILAKFTGSNPSQTASTYSIPVQFTIDNTTGVEYGVQVQFKFWMPKKVEFQYSDGGAVYYNYKDYSFHFDDLYEMGSGQTISAAENAVKALKTFNLSDVLSEWQSFHDNIVANQSYVSNISDYSSSENSYKRFNKNLLKMGNRLELWVRYYYVVDDVAYAGDWRHWLSEAPQQQDLVTGVNYVTGSDVSADSNQQNPSDQELSTEMPNPVTVLPSYQNVQVTVINQVPNNQQYPTLHAYQSDNLLLDTMNRYNDLLAWLTGFSSDGMTENGMDAPGETYKGGFGAFLQDMFGFIPWYVWSVIAVGFGLSIVIMIIKVL